MADFYECYGLVWGLRKPQKKIQSQILEAFSGDLLEVPNPPGVEALQKYVVLK